MPVKELKRKSRADVGRRSRRKISVRVRVSVVVAVPIPERKISFLVTECLHHIT